MGKPLCDTTMTPRNPRTNCACSTYPENLGPCDDFLEGGRSDYCVYCDHLKACHPGGG